MEIGTLVPKKKIFKVFYHIWTWKQSGYVAKIILTYFHFLVYVPISLHTKFGQKVKWFLRKTSLILICK